MNISELHELFLKHPTICTDTRKISLGCLFFALKGEKYNANQFANDAIKSGAAYAIIDEKKFHLDGKTILVNSVLETLQKLAAFHRETLKIPVIAIVGSNGKTTTKELITAVLKQKYNLISTPGNFNNHIGLPLTILQITNKHEIAVIEMGANHVGENAFLCEIAKPNYGVITNNGKDHLEGFGSMEGVAQSNSELYYYLLKNKGTAFVNANDEWLMRMARQLENKITYAGNFEGRKGEAHIVCYARTLQPTINFYIEKNGENITANLSGDYNFDNVTVAVAMGLHFKIKPNKICSGIEGYFPTNNRSEIIKKEFNTIYMDAYNANPSSMEVALKSFAAMPFTNKTVILGDMFELGKYTEEEHQNMVDLCVNLNLQNVYLCGDNFMKTKNNFHAFNTTNECKEFFKIHPLIGTNIFMKGSRSMRLEELLEVIN
ncbi:MAG: UDP-N-acetylmuramoyl-tripeptide--D-alanyl-D-alanine ligase [Bacteroidia bacterium]|nr:UDP-N-acetylmuramoyl-tripeptide--D-alanyl-D-alanine ligase [Bacteroidia bacterium]